MSRASLLALAVAAAMGPDTLRAANTCDAPPRSRRDVRPRLRNVNYSPFTPEQKVWNDAIDAKRKRK